MQGKYQVKPDLPFAPGSEVAGTVRAIGKGVTGFAPGDRVAAFCGTGGFAEQVMVPAGQVHPLPGSADTAEVAASLVTYGTSYRALKDRARLRAGETLLVLGAGGGVGLTAVELGKQMGARVIAVASTEEKLALTRAYGADETINHCESDVRARVKKITGGGGVDVIFDPVGGEQGELAIRNLAWQVRDLVMGFASGPIPRMPANILLLKNADLLGVLWGAALRTDPQPHAANVAQLMAWLGEGRIRPHIDTIYPLAEVPVALGRLTERSVSGKLVLRLGS